LSLNKKALPLLYSKKMGNWQLEVAKFALYLTVPVGAFAMYHQVDYFRDEVLRFERKVTTKESIANDAMLKEYMTELRKEQQAKLRLKLQQEAAAAAAADPK